LGGCDCPVVLRKRSWRQCCGGELGCCFLPALLLQLPLPQHPWDADPRSGELGGRFSAAAAEMAAGWGLELPWDAAGRARSAWSHRGSVAVLCLFYQHFQRRGVVSVLVP